jgi:hypothetical protein
VLARYQPMVATSYGTCEPGEEFVQVVPLIGRARTPVVARDWPKVTRKDAIRPLVPLIAARSRAIVPGAVRSLLSRLGITDRRLIGRVIRAVASDVITDKVAQTLLAAIERDLVSRDLL